MVRVASGWVAENDRRIQTSLTAGVDRGSSVPRIAFLGAILAVLGASACASEPAEEKPASDDCRAGSDAR